jgi:RNA polymerase sigma factor (sigma-70 family)
VPHLRVAAAPVASLDAATEDGGSLGATVQDTDSPPPWRDVLRDEAVQEVRRAVAGLPARERQVVCRRHALCGEPQSFRQIARALDVSAERARQLELQAMARLRTDDGLRALAQAA